VRSTRARAHKSRLIYDGPRLDVAELNGVPYIHEAEFDHSTDEYRDTYFLPATTANRAILTQLPASNSAGFVSIVARLHPKAQPPKSTQDA